MILITVLSVLNVNVLSQDVQSGTYSKTIDDEKSFLTYQISPAPMKQLRFNYTISFKQEHCCPIIYVYAKTSNSSHKGIHETHECFFGDKGFVNVAVLSYYFIYMKPNFPKSNCIQDEDEIVCKGDRHFLFSEERTWWYAVGYECDRLKPLNISLSLTYKFNEPLSCEQLKGKRCQKYAGFNTTVFPNRLGANSQTEAAQTFAVVDLLFRRNNCYLYRHQFACMSLFQECREGQLYLPCQQACRDFVAGCGAILRRWGQSVTCGNYPASLDSEECWYIPVSCPPLQTPQFGSVSSSGNKAEDVASYECESGYDLSGPPVKICTYSGKWNTSEEVKCVAMRKISAASYSELPLVLAILAITIIVLVILSVIGFRFRKTLSLIVMHNYYVNAKLQQSSNRKKVFITYSSLDSSIVESQVVPAMKSNLGNTWQIVTFERDFLPGRSLIDCVNEAVWESCAVLVLLTNNYIRSQWCEYEFTQALTRSAIDHQFRLIAIMYDSFDNEDPIVLENLPLHLKIFVDTRVYLSFREGLFWNKLRKGLTD